MASPKWKGPHMWLPNWSNSKKMFLVLKKGGDVWLPKEMHESVKWIFCYILAKPINFWSACSKHWMGGPRGGQSINAPSIPAAEEEEKSVFGRNSLLNYPGAAEQTVPLLIRRISTISHFQTTQGEELPLVYHPRSVIRHPGGLFTPKHKTPIRIFPSQSEPHICCSIFYRLCHCCQGP